MRHINFLMYMDPPVDNNVDWGWKIYLKDGSTNSVILWNAYSYGSTIGGYYVSGNGDHLRINSAVPYIFTLVKTDSMGVITAGDTTTSTYSPEPISFGYLTEVGPIERAKLERRQYTTSFNPEPITSSGGDYWELTQ